jgi:hypothetical protein
MYFRAPENPWRALGSLLRPDRVRGGGGAERVRSRQASVAYAGTP